MIRAEQDAYNFAFLPGCGFSHGFNALFRAAFNAVSHGPFLESSSRLYELVSFHTERAGTTRDHGAI